MIINHLLHRNAVDKTSLQPCMKLMTSPFWTDVQTDAGEKVIGVSVYKAWWQGILFRTWWKHVFSFNQTHTHNAVYTYRESRVCWQWARTLGTMSSSQSSCVVLEKESSPGGRLRAKHPTGIYPELGSGNLQCHPPWPLHLLCCSSLSNIYHKIIEYFQPKTGSSIKESSQRFLCLLSALSLFIQSLSQGWVQLECFGKKGQGA